MRHPQVVIYESAGAIAVAAEPLAAREGWLIRQPRTHAACLELVREIRATVFVLLLERHLVEELDMLAHVGEASPDCVSLVCTEVKPSHEQRRLLTGLVHDLGATHMMFPPWTEGLIQEMLACLMKGAMSHAVALEP